MSGRHGAAQGSDHAPLVARRRLLNVSAERERRLADGGFSTGTLGGVIPSSVDVRILRLRATRESRGLTRTQLALLAATTSAELAAIACASCSFFALRPSAETTTHVP